MLRGGVAEENVEEEVEVAAEGVAGENDVGKGGPSADS
jgi:hypothetical protein